VTWHDILVPCHYQENNATHDILTPAHLQRCDETQHPHPTPISKMRHDTILWAHLILRKACKTRHPHPNAITNLRLNTASSPHLKSKVRHDMIIQAHLIRKKITQHVTSSPHRNNKCAAKHSILTPPQYLSCDMTWYSKPISLERKLYKTQHPHPTEIIKLRLNTASSPYCNI
jgi:hypothetical protein